MNLDNAELTSLEHAFAALPRSLAGLLVLATVVCLGFFIHRALFRVLSRLVEKRDLFWRSLFW